VIFVSVKLGNLITPPSTQASWLGCVSRFFDGFFGACLRFDHKHSALANAYVIEVEVASGLDVVIRTEAAFSNFCQHLGNDLLTAQTEFEIFEFCQSAKPVVRESKTDAEHNCTTNRFECWQHGKAGFVFQTMENNLENAVDEESSADARSAERGEHLLGFVGLDVPNLFGQSMSSRAQNFLGLGFFRVRISLAETAFVSKEGHEQRAEADCGNYQADNTANQ
jgi:hypothetical protein